LHQVVEHMHHEQRIAVRTLVHEPPKRRRHGRRPQPLHHIRLHLRLAQEFQPQHLTQTVRQQVLKRLPQRMPEGDHISRPVGPQHQQSQPLLAPRHIGEQLDRGDVTPLQVFEHQHHNRVTRHQGEGLDELPQHALGTHPLHLTLQPVALVGLHQQRQLREPRRRDPPQCGHEPLARGLSSQPPEGFEQWQIRLPRPHVLHALPTADPEGERRRHLGQKLAHQRALANASLAGHEHQARLTLFGRIQSLLEERELGLAAHEWRCQVRGRASAPYLGTKPIPLPTHGLNVLGGGALVAQRLPEFPDTDAQDARTHMRLRPHVLRELLPRNDAPRMLHQVTQHRPRPGP
jgi:hypothetical protein